jgi:asparagine synthase (glutamine-hydrolysing)
MPNWLKGDLKSYTLSVLSPERLVCHDILARTTVARILSDHSDGRETNDTLIWSLVVFQTWFDLYVDGIPRNSQQAASAA